MQIASDGYQDPEHCHSGQTANLVNGQAHFYKGSLPPPPFRHLTRVQSVAPRFPLLDNIIGPPQ